MAGVNIPDGLTEMTHFPEIERYLKLFLSDLQKADANAQRVTSRLNYSNTNAAIPVWAGTVEHQTIQRVRRFDAGRSRFGQSNRSKVYQEAVMDPRGDIQERDWGQRLPEKSEGGYVGQALGPKVGCRYQLFIAIRIMHEDRFRHVGTVTAGFDKPPDRKVVDQVIQNWAKDGHPYVEYLKKTFNLGGPIH